MPVLLHIAIVAGAATLLAAWCGWGLARLTLPQALRPWGGWLAPMLGYALLLVVGYWLVRDVAGLPVVLAVVGLGAGIVNALAWWRTGPPRFDRTREHLAVLALLLVTFLVGVLPLLNYGYPAIIGGNWDVENYLPVARYLERGPISAIPSAAPNPLRDLNDHPPTIGLTLGFSIFHGSVDVLTAPAGYPLVGVPLGAEALTTFAIVMAWLRAMGVLAVYILFRAILGLRPGFALLGAAFVSAGALLLWVTLFNFGMQLAAWPLIPMGLVIGISSLEEVGERGWRGWPTLVGAAVASAALPVAYYPALTLFVPLAVGLGVALLLQLKPRLWVRTLLGVVALGGMTLLLALPTVGAYFEGFSYRYGAQLTTLGLFRYIPLTDIVGLTSFSLRGDPPVPVEAWAMFGLLLGLMAMGLLWGPRRVRWLGLALGAVAYMAWLRWGQEYPYAWMKGAAYAAFPFLGLAAAGAQALYKRWRSPVGRVARVAAVLAPVALLVMMAFSQQEIVSDHWRRPRLYATQMPDLLRLRQQVPAGSRVTLTSDAAIETVTYGLISYLLDHTTLLGRGQTGYSGPWSNGAPDEIGDYALLSRWEDPAPSGFSASDEVWRGGSFILYRRAPGVVAHLPLDRMMSANKELTLQIGENSLRFEEGQPSAGEAGRQVQLALAAFEPAQITVGGQVYQLPAGGSTLLTPPLDTPHRLAISNGGRVDVGVRWATLRAPGDSEPGMTPQPMTVLAHVGAAADGTTVTTTVRSLLPNAGPLVLALDIWDDLRGLHYGWYGVEQARSPAPTVYTLTLEIATGDMSAVGERGKPVALGAQFDGLKPGDYVAQLNVLAGARLLASSGEVFSFMVAEGGAITNVRVIDPPLVATAADRPLDPLAVQVGEGIELIGYALNSSRAKPGEEVALTLWWRVTGGPFDERSILLHLLDARGEKRAQADGPPADGAHPTSAWQAGEMVVDKHSIKLPEDLPPGDYNLAVGMYKYPSLEMVPMTRAGSRVEGDVVLISLTVER